MYKHGVYIEEVATPIVPPSRVDSSLPIFIGTAPSHLTDSHRSDGAGVPILANDYAEALGWLGYSDDWGNYSLCEAMYAYFQIYGMCPAIFINVFNPYGNANHRNVAVTATQALVAGSLIVKNGANPVADILIDTMVVKNQAGSTTFVLGTDYSVDFDDSYHVVITRIAGGGITNATDTLTIVYSTAKPSGVTTADIVTALSVVDQVYPMHLLIPGQLVAPKWSIDQTVAAAMLAKSLNINDSFRCSCLVDIDTSGAGADDYTKVQTKKAASSLSDPHMTCCWPLVTTGSGSSLKTYHLSTHLAAVTAQTDYENDGIPFASPSNHALRITGAVVASGASVYLGRDQANILNSQGVVTALNWQSGWKVWGNRTSGYPASTDPKDTFIPNRRMMDYVGNEAVTTFFQKVDFPISRRLVATIEDSFNDWLNGLIGRGALLSGKCTFLASDNPTTSLIDGQVTFRVTLGLQGPAEQITFILAMDPSAQSALWS